MHGQQYIIIIKKHLENNNDNDELYDSYDLAQLQGIAYKMTTNKSLNKIKKYLSTRVLNLQRKMSWYDEDKDNKPYTGIDNE